MDSHGQQLLACFLIAHEFSDHHRVQAAGQLDHRFDDQPIGGIVFAAKAAHIVAIDLE